MSDREDEEECSGAQRRQRAAADCISLAGFVAMAVGRRLVGCKELTKSASGRRSSGNDLSLSQTVRRPASHFSCFRDRAGKLPPRAAPSIEEWKQIEETAKADCCRAPLLPPTKLSVFSSSFDLSSSRERLESACAQFDDGIRRASFPSINSSSGHLFLHTPIPPLVHSSRHGSATALSPCCPP